MRLEPFELHRPESLEHAIELKASFGDEAAFIVGGTELLIALKARVLHYPHLIDLKQISNLRGVAADDDGTVTLGALTTHAEIARSSIVREAFGAYAKLSENVGNIRVRNAGTIGGNLCFGEPHADPPALLCALGAELALAGPDGQRRIAMEDFSLGAFETARQEDEILCAVELPEKTARCRAAYHSFGAHTRPAVGVAVVRLHNAIPERQWRIWAGSLAERPTRLVAVEAALSGMESNPTPATLSGELGEIAEETAGDIETNDDIHGSADYKRHLMSVLLMRSLAECLT